jgi:hypothetical protein
MTRKLSIVTAVGVAALGVGVPSAFGKVHALAEVAPVQAQSESAFLTGIRDAHERGVASATTAIYRDSFERAELPRGSVPVSLTTYRDSFERTELPRESVPVSVTTSGRDIEWPQIGVGFGIGLLLALGLGLTMRAVHIRPFAH